jgi:rhodanese-related sulfurtransferase
MNKIELVPKEVQAGPLDEAPPPLPCRLMSAIDEALASARVRLARVTPEEAAARQAAGALLVDTRSIAQRERDGEIPGALVVERNVLEWRLDPTSDARLPEAHADADVIVVCDEGYASSLVAAGLLDLGLRHATDLIGGFQAWRAAGLPVVAR